MKPILYNIMYFAQCSLELNKINREVFGIWVKLNEILHDVHLNLKKKNQGSIWYLGKIKRICVDFPITMIHVNLSKEINDWIWTLMYNELFIKQETPINHQTKLAFHMLTKKKFIVGDI